MLFEAVSELNGIGKFNQEIAVVKRISCSNLSITQTEITTYFIVTSQKEGRQSTKKVFYV